jgi:carboxymethylenebutenolidase
MPSFISDGKQIRLDHYFPKVPGNHPAVVLVHGSGGPLSGFDPFAEQAATLGVHVFVVHYFDRTGHSWVYPSQIEQHFLAWQQTLRDALTYIFTLPNIDKDRIALLGFSLGGYLSVSLAAEDERVTALVDVFGGIGRHELSVVKRLPPTLILHGDADTVVPVSEAYQLESVLKRLGTPYEIQILKGQGHAFTGAAQFQAMTSIARFLARQFQMSPVLTPEAKMEGRASNR